MVTRHIQHSLIQIRCFETYPAFSDSNHSVYTVLRYLLTKFGFIFAESKWTREALKREGKNLLGMKYSFSAYSKVYNIDNRFREKENLRIYQIRAHNESKEKIRTDIELMRLIYYCIDKGHYQYSDILKELKSKNEESIIKQNQIDNSLGRLIEMFNIKNEAKSYPYLHGFIQIHEKVE